MCGYLHDRLMIGSVTGPEAVMCFLASTFFLLYSIYFFFQPTVQ